MKIGTHPDILRAEREGMFWEEIETTDEQQAEAVAEEIDRLKTLAERHEMSGVAALEKYGYRNNLTPASDIKVLDALIEWDEKNEQADT